MLRKKMDNQEAKEFWQFVQKTSDEVADWPAWKRGEYTSTVTEKAGATQTQKVASRDAQPSKH